MELMFLVGRLLYGGYFLMNGLNHLTKLEGVAAYAGSKGVPMPKAAVILSGLMILLGGLGILLGMYVQWSAGLIALFLLAVSFKMHDFWAVKDPQAKMTEQVNFLKNMALLGAALMMLSFPAF